MGEFSSHISEKSFRASDFSLPYFSAQNLILFQFVLKSKCETGSEMTKTKAICMFTS